MEYRNSGVNTHYGGGLVAGVDRNAATEILGSSIVAASDSNNADISLKAKGTGTVIVGDSSNAVMLAGSTTPIKIVTGVSSYTPPQLSSFAQDTLSIVMTGLSTGDLILSVDFRGSLSTSYIVPMYYPTPSSNNDATLVFANVHRSSVSGSSGRVRWAYLDRT